MAFALDTAYRAGRSTLSLFNAGAEVQVKQDATPVTEADKNAERLIREAIETTYPEDSILGEEQGFSKHGSGVWIIDPIDGTKSFVCGVPLYATLLSYEVDGRPVLGVCYLPALDEILFAEEGCGAFWNGRPCRVSTKSSIAKAAISSGSHYSLEKYGRMKGFLSLAQRSMVSRTWSDAYGHALVATGRIEAMMDPIVQPWDISAMKLIVREAGGRFTDFSGGENPEREAISSNGWVHEEVLEAFRS